MKEPTELGKTIMSKRLAMGIDRSELSRRLGISRQAISSIETGNTGCLCRSKGVIKICEYFGIEIADFKTCQPKRKLKRIESGTALGKFLIRRRRELCLSRDDLCRADSLHADTLYLLEKGRSTKLSPQLREALEKALGCTIPNKYFTEPRRYLKKDKRTTLLSQHVLKFREKRGLTQKELARISKVSNNTITRIETGQGKYFRAHTIGKIFKALKCDWPEGLILH